MDKNCRPFTHLSVFFRFVWSIDWLWSHINFSLVPQLSLTGRLISLCVFWILFIQKFIKKPSFQFYVCWSWQCAGRFFHLKLEILICLLINIQGLPHQVDAAITWKGNRRTYFFRNSEYWKLDDGALRMVSGYPRIIGPAWMRCIDI